MNAIKVNIKHSAYSLAMQHARSLEHPLIASLLDVHRSLLVKADAPHMHDRASENHVQINSRCNF